MLLALTFALASLARSAVPADPHDPPGIDWSAAGDEAAQVLAGYLQVDTRNPPGHESAGARYLADVLAKEGIPSEIVEVEPDRGLLVARLKGDGTEKPICLLSHIDVVPFEADRWPADKGGLSGVIADGEVWGRGALDMKGMGALEVMTMIQLHRAGLPLRRDVILLAEPDEEVDGKGAKFLAEKYWGQIGCSQVINEGGLGLKDVLFPGQTLFGISVAEKGVLWVKLIAEGPAGHGSRPDPGQAPPKMTRALARIEQYKAKPWFHWSMLELFDAVGATRKGFERTVLRSPFLVRTVLKGKLMKGSSTRAILTDTINITGFRGGESPNVVPSQVEATLDCRLLPGTSPEAMIQRIKDLIQDPSIRVETMDHGMMSNESPTDDTLYRALAARAVEGRTDVAAGPVLSPGFTDSIFLRPLGVHAYGFVPFEITEADAGTMHGHAERVSVENVRNGLRILYRAIADVSVK